MIKFIFKSKTETCTYEFITQNIFKKIKKI